MNQIMNQPKGMLHLHSQTCPHCNANLVAQEITGSSRHLYLPLDTPDDGRFLFYSHLIGISSIWHDRILAYTCPFCDETDVIPGLEAYWAEYLRINASGGLDSPDAETTICSGADSSEQYLSSVLCDDEGCPQHGIDHVCITRAA